MVEDKIEFIVPVALREVMARLLPDFEHETGHRFEIAVMLNPEVPGYIAAGAQWDIAISNPRYVDEILTTGHGARGTHRPFARSPLAFGVRDATAELRHRIDRNISALLLETESIAVTETGTSGETFRRLTEMLGIQEALRPRLRLMAGGEPMAALIAGDVAMAALPLTNIAPVPGVFPAAICPLELGVHIDLSLCVRRDVPDAVLRFADWLTDPVRDAALRRLGAERFSLQG